MLPKNFSSTVFKPFNQHFIQHRTNQDRLYFSQKRLTSKIVFGRDDFPIPKNNAQRYSLPKFESGYLAAIFSKNFFVLLPHHMQDNALIGRIMLVPVEVPIVSANMNFNSAIPFQTIHYNSGVSKVGSVAVVSNSRPDYLYFKSVCSFSR